MKNILLLLGLTLVLTMGTACENNIQTIAIEDGQIKTRYSILPNGDLQITKDNQASILEINALPDSQIIQDDKNRILLLSHPTSQYKHGILGDDIEAKSVTIVELSEEPVVVSQFSVPEGWVIESILPIWSDWDDDGTREIVLTLSNSTSGAKLVLYDEMGNVLAESDSIGKGYRWRHTLEIASFGEMGQKLLVEVQTPHIGGIVGYYSWDKESQKLEKEVSITGFSTHDIGSRVMKMYALMNDPNSDQVLLIVPSQSKTEISALKLESGKIQEIWRLPLGGRLSGKLEHTEKEGGQVIKAVVDDNQEVFIELP